MSFDEAVGIEVAGNWIESSGPFSRQSVENWVPQNKKESKPERNLPMATIEHDEGTKSLAKILAEQLVAETVLPERVRENLIPKVVEVLLGGRDGLDIAGAEKWISDQQEILRELPGHDAEAALAAYGAQQERHREQVRAALA